MTTTCDRCFQFDRQIVMIESDIHSLAFLVRRGAAQETIDRLQQAKESLAQTKTLYAFHRMKGAEHRREHCDAAY